MSDVAKIVEELKGLDDSLELTPDAAEALTKVPGFVLSMALKNLAGKAKEAGITKIDADFVKAASPM